MERVKNTKTKPIQILVSEAETELLDEYRREEHIDGYSTAVKKIVLDHLVMRKKQRERELEAVY